MVGVFCCILIIPDTTFDFCTEPHEAVQYSEQNCKLLGILKTILQPALVETHKELCRDCVVDTVVSENACGCMTRSLRVLFGLPLHIHVCTLYIHQISPIAQCPNNHLFKTVTTHNTLSCNCRKFVFSTTIHKSSNLRTDHTAAFILEFLKFYL